MREIIVQTAQDIDVLIEYFGKGRSADIGRIRLRLNIHDDTGHEVTSFMMQDACDWFRKYLQA